MGCVKQLDFDTWIGRLDSPGNGFCHFTGRLPHCVVDEGNLVFLVIGSPGLVGLDDLQGIVTPDHTVAGADQVNRQPQVQDFFDFAGDLAAEGRQDIGIVFQRLGHQFALVCQVIEQGFSCIMLAETIVAEQDVFAGHVGEHGVRPMQHRCFDKD